MMMRIAQGRGDLAPDEDLEQLFFEIDAYLLYGHAAFAFRDDPVVLERASAAVCQRLSTASGERIVRP